jgi:hypothetical protein
MTKELLFNTQQCQDIFLLSKASKQILGSTQPASYSILKGCPSAAVKQLGHEAASPPTWIVIKNDGAKSPFAFMAYMGTALVSFTSNQ